jgi:hypothetical protein
MNKFITFGSHENFINAGNRLLEQAKSMSLFEETILYTGEHLKTDDCFWEKHRDFINKNSRGYGYWLWKPYIIQQTMNKMKNGDILLYLDCGCEIAVAERASLVNDIEFLKQSNKCIMGTTTEVERCWNKMDLILKLEMNYDRHLNTAQRQGGTQLILVCDESRELVNKWYDLACDYHMIDDSPSVNKNLDCFREHRHDQSIFSLLTKKYDLYADQQLKRSWLKVAKNRTGISNI